MKILAAFLVLTIFSCSSSKNDKENSAFYERDSVYYQKWVAGIQGGGSGIHFHVIFKEPLKEDCKLEKVRFQSYVGVFVKESETHYVAYITTDTNRNDLILDKNPEKEYGNKAPEITLKPNEANLFFKINGKETMKNLQNVKEKEMLAYPSMERPKN